jgi:segregation and condensation protein A
MLLPRPSSGDDDEEGDPRAELIRRLQEYERFQKAAEALDRLPQVGRDIFPVRLPADEIEPSRPAPEVELRDLIDALREVLARSRMYSHHEIEREALSVRECMSRLLDRLRDGGYHDLRSLLVPAEGRLGVVVTFLALLELAREALVELQQRAPYEPIYVVGAGVDHK